MCKILFCNQSSGIAHNDITQECHCNIDDDLLSPLGVSLCFLIPVLEIYADENCIRRPTKHKHHEDEKQCSSQLHRRLTIFFLSFNILALFLLQTLKKKVLKQCTFVSFHHTRIPYVSHLLSEIRFQWSQ